MHNAGFGAKAVEPPGGAVAKARAHHHEQVAFLHQQVCGPRTVHAQHAHGQLVPVWYGAKPAQRHDRRYAAGFHKGQHGFRSFGRGCAPAQQQQGPLCAVHKLCCPGKGLWVGLRHGRGCASNRQILHFGNGYLHIAWNIHQHRAGAVARGYGKGLGYDAQKFVYGAHNKVVLGGGNGHAVDVHLLKGVRANHAQGNLPRDADQRHGVHARVGQGRKRVGGSRAGCGKDNAGAASDPGHALSYETRALLVPGEDVADCSPAPEGVVKGKIETARNTRNVRNTLVFQQADGEFCSRKT